MPPGPVTVPVYVVPIVRAVVVVVPLAIDARAPMPLSIEKPDALVVTQERTDVSPEFMFAGVATSVQVGAGGGPGGTVVTPSVAVQVVVPPGPVAVPV